MNQKHLILTSLVLTLVFIVGYSQGQQSEHNSFVREPYKASVVIARALENSREFNNRRVASIMWTISSVIGQTNTVETKMLLDKVQEYSEGALRRLNPNYGLTNNSNL